MYHGGKVALLDFQPRDAQTDWNQVILKGLTLKGIYSWEMFETWYKMGSMLQSDLNLSPVITHHYPINQFESGFQVMNSGQSGKVILDWNGC